MARPNEEIGRIVTKIYSGHTLVWVNTPEKFDENMFSGS